MDMDERRRIAEQTVVVMATAGKTCFLVLVVLGLGAGFIVCVLPTLSG